MEKSIKELLACDALAEAERLTGESYKTSEATIELGFLLQQKLGEQKKRLLTELGDTTFLTETKRYISIIEKAGFTLAYKEPFHSSTGRSEERLYIYYLPGFLLCFDTFHGNVNAASLYFVARAHDQANPYPNFYERYGVSASGGVGTWYDTDQEVSGWVGNFDAREALLHKIRAIHDYGTPCSPWPKTPWLWLLHHEDTKKEDYDHKAITYSRICALPEHVRLGIGQT